MSCSKNKEINRQKTNKNKDLKYCSIYISFSRTLLLLSFTRYKVSVPALRLNWII